MSDRLEWDILARTADGRTVLLASSSNPYYAAVLAEAVYWSCKDGQIQGFHLTHTGTRDMRNPRRPKGGRYFPQWWDWASAAPKKGGKR